MIGMLGNTLTRFGSCLRVFRYTFCGLQQRIGTLTDARHNITGTCDQMFEFGSQLSDFVLSSKFDVDGQVAFSHFGNQLLQLHQRAGQVVCESIHQQDTEQHNNERCPDHGHTVARHQFIDRSGIQIRTD
ncbi:hypothetical protein D3C74_404640 [compost metagenome]